MHRFGEAAALRQQGRAPQRHDLQPHTLVLEPLLECGRAADEEPLEQIAAIEVEGVGQAPRFGRALELDDVAADPGIVEADVFIAAAHEHAVTERMPQAVQRLAQCGAGMLLVELGPKQCDEGVASVQASGCGDGEVGEQGNTLGLGQHRPELVPASSAEVERAQNPKLDHADPLQRFGHRTCPKLRRQRHPAVTAGVTCHSRGAATVSRRPERTASGIAPQRHLRATRRA